MDIPSKYTLNERIKRLLFEIDKLFPQLAIGSTRQERNILKFRRQKSILKSSLFSARIEGNSLTLDSFSNQPVRSGHKSNLEINNLYHALEHLLSSDSPHKLSLSDLYKLHSLVMDGLGEGGRLRTEPSAIFNTAGIAIYLCPPASEVKPLLSQLLNYANNSKEHPLLIASSFHFTFEKIHPFLDGNGRVGRLLLHLLVKTHGLNFHGLAPFEEYLDNHRQDYYDLLNSKTTDITSFVEFMLESFVYGLNQATSISNLSVTYSPEQALSPRRQELLAIIRDHPQVSFDFLHRRFVSISPRLLRFDLKNLQDKGFVRKLGTTKGALYEPII